MSKAFTVVPQAVGIFQQPEPDCLASALPYDPEKCLASEVLTRGIVTDTNGNLIRSGNPARSGQPLVLWLTGLGAAAKNVATGYTESVLRPELWLLNKPITTGASVLANLIPSEKATILFAGPSTNYGLDQINFTFDLSNLRNGKLCGTAFADDIGLAVRLSSSPAGTGYSNVVRLPVLVKAGEFPCL